MRVACDLVKNVDSVSEGLRICLSNKPLGLIHAAGSQNTLRGEVEMYLYLGLISF